MVVVAGAVAACRVVAAPPGTRLPHPVPDGRGGRSNVRTGTGGSVHAPSQSQFHVQAPLGAPEAPGTAIATLTFEPPVTVTMLLLALVPVAVALFPC